MIPAIESNVRGAPVCGGRRPRLEHDRHAGLVIVGTHARRESRGARVAALPSGDGYLRARVGGAIETDVDWPNGGTVCDGEPKAAPAGVRMSFRRAAPARPNLLFVFGLTGVREGQPLTAGRVNLTVFDQGRGRVLQHRERRPLHDRFAVAAAPRRGP